MFLARSVALLSAVAVLVGAQPGMTQPAVTSLRLGIIPSITAAQAYYAEQMGFFKKHGLNVEIQTMNSGASIAAAVAGGSLDVGFADVVSITNARERGLPFSYIAAGILNTSEFPLSGLLVRADSAARDAKSLNGQTIAVNAVNTFSTVATDAWVDSNGGDSKTLKFIELPLPQMASAVAQGTVQGAFAGEPFFTMAIARGDLRVAMFTKGGIAATYMPSGWFADAGWIQKNKAIAAQFAAAMYDAAVWANANRQAVAPILVSSLKLPEAVARGLSAPPYYGEALRVTDIQPVIDAAVKYGAIQTPFRAQDLIASLR